MPMSSGMMSKPIVWIGAAAAAGGAYWYYKNRDNTSMSTSSIPHREHSVTVKHEKK
jgi:hypothetical protein